MRTVKARNRRNQSKLELTGEIQNKVKIIIKGKFTPQYNLQTRRECCLEPGVYGNGTIST